MYLKLMERPILKRFLTIFLVFCVAGCNYIPKPPPPTKEPPLGTIVGVAAGGALGFMFAQKYAVGSGKMGRIFWTVAGVAIGHFVGNTITESDALKARGVAHSALISQGDGATMVWKNEETGHAGSFTPLNTYPLDGDQEVAESRLCRDFETSFEVEGEAWRGRGTACQAEDGSWLSTL
jgi:surface antigen